MTIGVALVGAGRVAPLHLDALATMRQARLVAIADPDIAAARALAERYGAAAEDDVGAVLRSADVDAVIVTAPTQHHHALASTAIRARKHVLVEKPFTTTLKQARELIRMATEARVVVASGQVMRFMPMFAWAERFIDADGLGKPIQVIERRLTHRDETMPWWRDLPYFLVGHWGSHSIDLVHHLLGARPARVYCDGGSYVAGYSGTDDCTIMVTMAGGARLSSHLSFSARAETHDIVMIGTRATLEFECYRSVAVDGEVTVEASQEEMLARAFQSQLGDFLEGAATGRCRADARTVLGTIAAIEAAEASLRTSQAVTVEEVET